MRSSIFGIYHSGGVFHPSATYIGQFGKLTDRIEREPRSLSLTASSASPLTVAKEPRALSLPKGPFPNSIFIPSLTHPALKDVCVFSVSFPCNSVANSSASAFSFFRVSASVFSVKFRVNPWLMLLLLPLPLLILPSVAIILFYCNLSPILDISEIL